MIICIVRRLCLYKNDMFQRILSHQIKQNFSILRHFVGEILHFEFDAYRGFLTRVSGPKNLCGCMSKRLKVIYTKLAKSGINMYNTYHLLPIRRKFPWSYYMVQR